MTQRWRLASLALAAACGGTDPGPAAPPPAEAGLVVWGGDQQAGPAGSTLPVDLAVRVTSAAGAPEAGVPIRFTATAGGGAVTPAEAATDADGVARARLRLGGAGAQAVRAEVVGAPERQAAFAATALSGTLPAAVATVPIPPSYGIHDTFVRDGLAFVSAWNTGLIIYDVGHGIRGGSPSRPVEVSRIVTPNNGLSGARVHNAWWFHNPVRGERRYVFVGQEGPGIVGQAASGDITVVDVSSLTAPRTVATFRAAGAGVHNVWMDEAREILYAAYYNGGVLALDVSGTLSGDLTGRAHTLLQPGGTLETYTWGVQFDAARGLLYASDMESGFWALSAGPGTALAVAGGGRNVPDRWTSDLWIHGGYGYTGTWGSYDRNGNTGNALYTWRLDGPGAPALADSLLIDGIATVSDVEVSADGQRLLLTFENGPSSGFNLYSLANPARPAVLRGLAVGTGLHTGTFAEIGGRRYVFAAKNPPSPALLVFDVTE